MCILFIFPVMNVWLFVSDYRIPRIVSWKILCNPFTISAMAMWCKLNLINQFNLWSKLVQSVVCLEHESLE